MVPSLLRLALFLVPLAPVVPWSTASAGSPRVVSEDPPASPGGLLEESARGQDRELAALLATGELAEVRAALEALRSRPDGLEGYLPGLYASGQQPIPGTALMFAARNNTDPAVVALLLEAGADIDRRDERGRTALSHAAEVNPEPAVAAALLAAEARLETRGAARWTPLAFASGSNGPGMVELLLEAGADPSSSGEGLGPPPLGLAATRPDGPDAAEIVGLLVGAGASLELADEAGRLPLEAAVAHGRAATARVLLELGADVDAQGPSGDRALHAAARRGSAPLVELLLAADADLESHDARGRTPLMVAVAPRLFIEGGADAALDPGLEPGGGSDPAAPEVLDVLELLLASGADPSAHSRAGWTVLCFAAAGAPSVGVVERLLAAGATRAATSDRTWPPLAHAAASHPDPAIALALVDGGCDLDEVFHDGTTAVGLAAEGNAPEVVIALLDRGALLDPEEFAALGRCLVRVAAFAEPAQLARLIEVGSPLDTVDDGWTAVSRCAKSNGAEALAVLFESGLPVDHTDPDGSTALMLAAGHNDAAVVRYLLGEGASLDLRQADGSTPLMWAAGRTDPAVLTLLLEAGANPRLSDRNRWTALHYAAAYSKDPSSLGLLLEAGLRVDERTSIDATALMIAADRNPEPAVVAQLLDAGADLEALDEDAWTPLIYAAYSESPEVVRLLFERGADLTALDQDGLGFFEHCAKAAHEDLYLSMLYGEMYGASQVGSGR